jgi:uncharacterized membrane protein YciS (DUF1049 family)|tara:strand:+ start:808 stop:999 length:192 start_codon:yes stop_codon:yes gene_type:complete
MRVDLKTLATILGLLALVGGSIAHFGGFYYTTELRLESLEEKVSKLEKKIQRQDRKKNKGSNK